MTICCIISTTNNKGILNILNIFHLINDKTFFVTQMGILGLFRKTDFVSSKSLKNMSIELDDCLIYHEIDISYVIIMQFLAEVRMFLSMGLWNSIVDRDTLGFLVCQGRI